MSDEHIDDVTAPDDEPEGYDTWFRAQVEEALEEDRKPGAIRYSLEEVDAMMQRAREERDRQRFEKAS
jgi:hypothetical protein